MKTNGVPEKLYLLPNGLISYCRNTDEDAEYTYTDAFIEKAEKWIKNNGYMYNGECEGDVKAMAEDFVNYMKGE